MKTLLVTLIALPLLQGCEMLNQHTSGLGLTTQSSAPANFVIAGQSNGSSGIQGTQGPLASATGRVYINDNTGYDAIPTESNPSSVSITWIYLGDMLTGITGHQVSFYNLSRGNTNTNQWIANGWYKDIGPKARATHATAVLWIQGESDSMINLGVEVTYQNMKQMILDSRQYVPDLKWYVALDSLASDNPRVAQQRLISEGLAFQGPDIDTLRATEPTWFEPSRIEISNVEGFKGHAQAWYDILSHDQRWKY